LTACAAISVSGCFGMRASVRPEIPREIKSLTLIGQASIPPLGLFPPAAGMTFGGISGIALDNGGTLLGVSDAQLGGRIYQFSIEGMGSPSFRIAPYWFVPLEAAKGRDRADDESLVVLRDGTIVVCAEGTSTEPRLPPALNHYTRDGAFLNSLPVREHYAPEATGTVTKGARGNAGFESVTMTPDGGRLFTAAETALVQDGELATFDAGTQARIAEYVPRRNSFEPLREFVYPLEPVNKPSFTPSFFINGLADLLALNRTTLLALERGFVDQDKTATNGPRRGMNTIRIYRVSLTGATDVSKLDSLKGQSGIVPVTKTLLVDLSQMQGLSPELAPELDNFEGLAFGPRLPDGRATLLVVSDDNFSDRQRTWFLLFAIE
jgi:3-phytase